MDRKDLASLDQDALALGGELHDATVLLEELALETALQEADMLAQGGLADVPDGCGLAEPSALGDRDESAQALNVE